MSDQLLINGLHALRLVEMFDVGAAALFVWDYILTFGMEVDLVWKSKWNFIKGLYLFQRYMPFIDTIFVSLYFQLGENLTKTACAKIYPVAGVLTMTGFATSEMVLTLRTWAVWNRNKHLGVVLLILYVLVWGSGYVVLGIYLNSVTFGDPPFRGFQGCFPTHANGDIVFLWVQIIAWDTLMLVLILVPGVRAYRYSGNSALMRTVYHDGIVYYICLFLLSFFNILLVETLPPVYRLLLTTVARVLHSMLASRVVLHIRAQSPGRIYSDGVTS